MVYGKEPNGNGGYVACILYNGVPMHERADGVVEFPFEAEYQIRLRNKTDKDAVAKIYIDNELITPTGLIVRKRGSYNNADVVDLDCNIATRKKFKFVAVDSFDAIDHGKNRPNDPSMGVIRVEFYTEKTKPVITYFNTPSYRKYFVDQPVFTCGANYSEQNCATSAILMEMDDITSPRSLEAGATVDGAVSSQGFITSWIDIDWNQPPTIIQVVLKGYWQDELPKPAALVRHCTKCQAKRKRPSAKFCEICGSQF